MIALQSLITLAPFEEEIKNELLAKVDTFDDGKKLELINMCWGLISQWYHNEIQHRYNLALLEIAEGKKEYTQEEMEKIPDVVFTEFTHKLQEVEQEVATEEDLEEVREKLEDVTEKTQQQ